MEQQMQAIHDIVKSALESLTPEQMKALTMEPFEELRHQSV